MPLLDRLLGYNRFNKTNPSNQASLNNEGLAPEQLVEEAYKLLAKDKARLSGTNYPVYKGKTISPMSSLTQRAEELQNKFNQKPSPYSGKISTVLNRNNQGISPANIQEILQNLSQGQREFGQGPILQTLRDQFLSSYDPRIDRFRNKTEKDINRLIPEATGKLSDISRVSGNLEASRNQQIAQTLRSMQEDKQARRKGLVGNLEQFGSQRHAYNNMVNGANKGQFMQEANEPYDKIRRLEEALRPYASGMDGMHPDLAKSNSDQIIQALRAYGVDPSKPADQWESTKTGGARYPGKLVADLPPEILASGNVLEGLTPSLRDSYRDKRKEITRGLLNNENLSAKALQNLPSSIQGQISALEKAAKDRMQKELGTFNNKYIKLGQYNSPQHIQEAEERARAINKSVLERRNDVIQNALKEQLQLQHGDEVNNIRQLGMLSGQSHKEYGDLLSTLRNVNQQGANKFANDQAENEEVYKNFQNEKAWEYPHMRNSIRREGMGAGRSSALNEIFSGLADKNISLDNLANLNTNYSNLEKERNDYRTQITSMQQAQAELQKQLGIQQTKAKNKAAQEIVDRNHQNLLAQEAESRRLFELAKPQHINTIINRFAREVYDKYASERGGAFGAAQFQKIEDKYNNPQFLYDKLLSEAERLRHTHFSRAIPIEDVRNIDKYQLLNAFRNQRS